MAEKCDVGKILEMAKSAFDNEVKEALTDGLPEELGVSPYKYMHDYGYVEALIVDAIEEVDSDSLRACQLGKDALADFLEAYWRTQLDKGEFENLSKSSEI